MNVKLGASIVLLWATGYLAGGVALRDLPPFQLVTFRFAVSAVLLASVALVRRARWPRGKMLWHVVVAGLLVQAGQFAGVYGGMRLGVSPTVTSLIMALNPVVTATMAAGFLRERLTKRRVLALLLGICSVIAALGGKALTTGTFDDGTWFTLFGLLCFAGGGLYQQRFVSGGDHRANGAVQLAVSVPVVGVFALFEHGASYGSTGLWMLAWIVLANSVGGTLLYLRSVQRAGAARTTMLFSAVPATTALLAFPVLGQVPDVGAVLGIVLGAAACLLGASSSTARRSPIGARSGSSVTGSVAINHECRARA